jgi:hypothetical protein
MTARPERRGRPKHLLLLAATALAATGVVVGPAAAQSTNAADKETLLHPTATGPDCGHPETEGTPTESTAVIKKTGTNTVSATVTLKDGLPNQIYQVFLITTPSGSGCLSPAGFARTNGQGNDSLRVSVPLAADDTGAYVNAVSPFGQGDRLQTEEQVFGTK